MITVTAQAKITVTSGAANTGLSPKEIMNQALTYLNASDTIPICASNGSPMYIGLQVQLNQKNGIRFQED